MMSFSRLFDKLRKLCVQASVHEMGVQCVPFYRIDTKVSLDYLFLWTYSVPCGGPSLNNFKELF